MGLEGGSVILRIWLLPLLVLVTVLEATSLVVSPNFSLWATPSVVATGQGEVATTTITVAPSGGFAAAVALSVSGVPAGVTAALVPGVSAGATVLWLTVSNAAQAASATLTVMGVGGGVVHTLEIYLKVSGFVSNFWIFANPASLSVARGSSVTSTVFATPLARYTDLPMFNATGLPAGVIASFGPTASGLGSRATLTLTAAGTAPPGSAEIVVTGHAASLTATTRISLTVR